MLHPGDQNEREKHAHNLPVLLPAEGSQGVFFQKGSRISVSFPASASRKQAWPRKVSSGIKRRLFSMDSCSDYSISWKELPKFQLIFVFIKVNN